MQAQNIIKLRLEFSQGLLFRAFDPRRKIIQPLRGHRRTCDRLLEPLRMPLKRLPQRYQPLFCFRRCPGRRLSQLRRHLHCFFLELYPERLRVVIQRARRARLCRSERTLEGRLPACLGGLELLSEVTLPGSLRCAQHRGHLLLNLVCCRAQ